MSGQKCPSRVYLCHWCVRCPVESGLPSSEARDVTSGHPDVGQIPSTEHDRDRGIPVARYYVSIPSHEVQETDYKTTSRYTNLHILGVLVKFTCCSVIVLFCANFHLYICVHTHTHTCTETCTGACMSMYKDKHVPTYLSVYISRDRQRQTDRT